jgi:hypothetical protein
LIFSVSDFMFVLRKTGYFAVAASFSNISRLDGVHMFEMGKDYTRDYIHAVCGGNKQAFLPALNGKIVAACLRLDLNPHAPDVILCSSSSSARAAGRMLAEQEQAIPVFVGQGEDHLRYMGDFAVAESLTAPLDCEPYVRNTSFTATQISRVIKLKRCS